MDNVLAFFSTLILITAGIVVCLLWFALIGAICIEIYDAITGNNGEDQEEEDYIP
jgi:hypothetical protein